MKLALSNIAWLPEQDGQVYHWMGQYGFTGLEIAPTRVVAPPPYEHGAEAKIWHKNLSGFYRFTIPSMQSIWYGRQEQVFGTKEERQWLLEYSIKAFQFANAVHCPHLVFGCPKNRRIPAGMAWETAQELAVGFFRELGESAKAWGTVVGLEANPQIYGTNFINDTVSAFDWAHRINSAGIQVNLDVGTMIQNREPIDGLYGKIKMVSHVHVSEPHLAPIQRRKLHQELAQCLAEGHYEGFLSIEMAKPETLSILEESMHYVKEVFLNGNGGKQDFKGI